MSSNDPGSRFPNMTPISGPPALFRVNGCGLALVRPGALRDRALALPETKRALELLRDDAERFPARQDAFSRACFAAVDPALAARVTAAMAADPVNALDDELRALTGRHDPSATLERWFTAMATGGDAAAAAVFAEAKKDGTPLPDLLK